jgi:dTDP-4-dehydrorhamnose 3,5-epimerase
VIQHKHVESSLQILQQALIQAGHWSESDISAEALSSQQPFCLDTMNFSQWLQFVFIPNIQALIDAQQKLPCLIKGQGLEPMASEFYTRTEADCKILAVICQIDELLQTS